MKVEIDIEGVDEIAAKLSGPAIKRMTARAVSLASDIVLQETKRAAPEKSGKLKKAHKRTVQNKLHHSIVEGTDYGPIIRKGSPPHIIRPDKKLALHWPGGPVVQRVSHPGFKAIRYHDDAVRAAEPRIRGILAKLVKETVATLNKGVV